MTHQGSSLLLRMEEDMVHKMLLFFFFLSFLFEVVLKSIVIKILAYIK